MHDCMSFTTLPMPSLRASPIESSYVCQQNRRIGSGQEFEGLGSAQKRAYLVPTNRAYLNYATIF